MEKVFEYLGELNQSDKDSFDCQQNINTESTDNNHEKLIEELNQLSNEIILLDEEPDQNNELVPSDSKLNLKQPPDIEEILSLNEEEITPTSYNVGIINNACQNVLRDMEQQLVHMLKKNRKEQELIQNYLNSSERNPSSEKVKKTHIKCAGMPYFKDLEGYPAPLNVDVLKKQRKKKLLPIDFIDSNFSWNLSESKKLMNAVNECIKSLPFERSIDSKSIDWMKISATYMGGKYSPTECKSKWMLNLKPDINKGKWLRREIKLLEKVVEEHNYQDWDKIALALGTNRTGFQCCVKYHSSRVLNSGKWTKEEDELLIKLTDKFKMRDYIPWKKVTWHFDKRSLRQCQERYCYCLGKIKKGNFTREEDFALIFLASRLKNFGEVAKYLPHRVSTQIRHRYDYLVKLSMPKFTEEEDELLSSLMIKYPRNWEKISEYFPNRSITQCRNRWSEIQKEIVIDDVENIESEDNKVSGDSNKVVKSKKTARKSDISNIKKDLPKLSKLSVKSSKKKPCGEYSKLLEYFNHCHKFLFGPKIKMPSVNVEETSKMCKNFQIVATILSVNNLNLLNSYDIDSLKTNCEFETGDIQLLNEMKRKISENDKPVQIRTNIIPPNFITLVGLRSILLGWSKIWNLTRFYEVNTNQKPTQTDSYQLFSDAKKLFKDRMRALFALPAMLSHLSQEGIQVKPVCKPKARKSVKQMSKLKRKEHAKLMNRAYKNSLKKKMKEKFGDGVLVKIEQDLMKSQGNTEDISDGMREGDGGSSSAEIEDSRPKKRKYKLETESEESFDDEPVKTKSRKMFKE